VASKIILVVGVPGAGKTWVCHQLRTRFVYIPHDDYPVERDYFSKLMEVAKNSDVPVLGEAPFGISKFLESCDFAGITTVPVFIIEDDAVILDRYYRREGKMPFAGTLTRQQTYRERADQLGAFQGTSEEVLNYLKGGM
jgi:hypothetical protein